MADNEPTQPPSSDAMEVDNKLTNMLQAMAAQRFEDDHDFFAVMNSSQSDHSSRVEEDNQIQSEMNNEATLMEDTQENHSGTLGSIENILSSIGDLRHLIEQAPVASISNQDPGEGSASVDNSVSEQEQAQMKEEVFEGLYDISSNSNSVGPVSIEMKDVVHSAQQITSHATENATSDIQNQLSSLELGYQTGFSHPQQDITQPTATPKKSLNTQAQTSEIVGVDSDEDFMIIELDQASSKAKAKWNKPREIITIEEDATPIIKEEPSTNSPLFTPPKNPHAKGEGLTSRGSRPPKPAIISAHPPATPRVPSSGLSKVSTPTPKRKMTVQQMLAAQRDIVARNRQRGGGLSGNTDGSPQIEGSSSAQTSSSSHPQENERSPEDDESWQNEESGEDKILEKLIEDREHLEGLLEAGMITEEEQYDLIRIRENIERRLRVLTASNQEGDEKEDEDLFVPERDKTHDVRTRHWEDRQKELRPSPDYDSDAVTRRMVEDELRGDNRVPKDPRKKRAARPKNAKEAFEAKAAKERSKAAKKQSRKKVITRKATPPVKSKGKGRAKAKGTSAKSSKKAKDSNAQVLEGTSLLRNNGFGAARGEDHIVKLMLEKIMASDPINDHLQNPARNAEPEPSMPGKNRTKDQFQKLYSNIPIGNNAQVRSDKARLREASKSFGYAKVTGVGGKWLIKGMKTGLYHHQLLGAQWMVERELSSEAPYGGLLADSMGLGKTVQTLACMVGNPASDQDFRRGVRATLIVVPAAIVNQWWDEISQHVDSKLFNKVIKYKKSYKIPRSVLSDCDIVITSYHEVMREFPFPDDEGKEMIAREGYKNWRITKEEEVGNLHQVYWYRVILDEAQAIKNNSCRTSVACQALKGIYRWCLTGTPLLNRLEELFPYLRFLKADYSMDWGVFQKYFCDANNEECFTRIATLLSYTMMRRTMKTTILNRPIINLPPPTTELKQVAFSEEEKIVYRITENRFRANLNTFFAKGVAQRNYAIWMIQLLRLRQCTSHPLMLERTIKENWTAEDVSEFRAKISALRDGATGFLGSDKFYEQCNLWVQHTQAEREAALANGENLPDIPFGNGNYGYSFNMDNAIDALDEAELLERVICSLCQDMPMNPVQTSCGHIFCEECLTSRMHERNVAHVDEADDNDVAICPQCSLIFEFTTPVPLPAQQRAGSESENGKGKNRIPDDSKGKDAFKFEPWTPHSTWITMSDKEVDEGGSLSSSAKTTALKATLLRGFAEEPFDKVVIYVQFRALARIVGRICNSENWGFLYMTGDIPLDQREKVVQAFRDRPEIKILVSGLKCGGLGLNFPWANRCISLDLWWNYAVEQQAFGRLFRIGQMKPTYMTRIVVKNSVDQRLLTMQADKLKAIGKAIGNGPGENGAEDEDGAKRGRGLDFKSLANLFGFLRTDAAGAILSVEADYDDLPNQGHGVGNGEGGSRSARGSGAEGYDDAMEVDED